jgi:hypothetical protein
LICVVLPALGMLELNRHVGRKTQFTRHDVDMIPPERDLPPQFLLEQRGRTSSIFLPGVGRRAEGEASQVNR